MGLTVTADQASYSPNQSASVTVVRDHTTETVPTVYPITFNESGSVTDTGSIDLTVLTPVGATVITPVDASGLLAFTLLSDDGDTAVFDVAFPTTTPPVTPALATGGITGINTTPGGSTSFTAPA